MKKMKVFVSSGHDQQWAIGDDLNLTRMALKDIVELTSLEDCDVAHFVYYEGLLNFDIKKFIGKRIICHMSAEPLRYLQVPRFNSMKHLVGEWISQSTQAKNQMDRLGMKNTLIPYVVNTDIFKKEQKSQSIIETWKIPSNSYIISNFHRDTEGHDLKSPKLVKGPDIFLNIMKKVASKHKIHILLAGPRRFWLRTQLAQNSIPYSYVGKIISGDDMRHNILAQELVNKLYNVSDLYVISSRSEGGPRTLIESAAAQCKVISTRVGLAEDVLCNESIYESEDDAVRIIDNDINNRFLDRTIDIQYGNIVRNNTMDSSKLLFQNLYNNISSVPIFKGK